MRRLSRLIGVIAIGVGLVVAWRRRVAVWSVLIGAGSGRSVNSARQPNDATVSNAFAQRVPFEWIVLERESAPLEGALRSAGLPFILVSTVASSARGHVLRGKLSAVGMQFDQEPMPLPDGIGLVRASGAADVDQLREALERFLQDTMEGLIVDTTARVVEIDEHTDLGAGAIVLVEPGGAHQLRSGSRRPLTDALQAAADRMLPLGFRPRPDLGALRRELADLPPAIDDLLLELLRPSIPGGRLSYERAERLGALRRCDQCQTPIVDLAELSEVVTEFYGASDRRQDVADALVRSGLEVGDPLTPNFCSMHGQITPTSNQ